MSLFRKKKNTIPRSNSNTGLIRRLSSSNHSTTSTSTSPHNPQPPQSIHVDDFGRPILEFKPAFSSSSTSTTPKSDQLPFGSGCGIGSDQNLPSSESQLLYGYAPIASTVELGLGKVEEIVEKCSKQIRERGLETPLIMSSMALDISSEGVCSLIRSYLNEDSKTFDSELSFATPLSIGAFLKWGLARLVVVANEQGGGVGGGGGKRGFVRWESYKEFRNAEKARGFDMRSCSTYLIARLPVNNGQLLTSLLSLFSSISAHSSKNGMPPRKLAALFSPYVFGLSDDQTFDATYEEWKKGTDALEHIILSFIRDQQSREPLPTFLEKFILGYPSNLNVSYNGESTTSKSISEGSMVRLEEVTRVRRLTRFHSRNLIKSAATWDVPNSKDWNLFFPSPNTSNNDSPQIASSPSLSPYSNTPSTTTITNKNPIYTSTYRHLLNIRSNPNHNNSNESNEFEDDDDYEMMGRFRTTVDREWSKFGEMGFSDVDEKKLEFDLTEGEREVRDVRRESMDWTTFESSGFQGRELFAPQDLVFQHSLKQRLNTWPSNQRHLNERIRATENMLPAFPYDTTPHEEPRIEIDALFFETWADVLVGGGWARDELKESSFALIQWKCRSKDGEEGTGGGSTKMRKPRVSAASSRSMNGSLDSRTEERWVLVEEFVPRDYREALTDPKVPKPSKRISFLRTVRRKNTNSSKPSPTLLGPPLTSSRSSVGIGNTLNSPASTSRTALRPIDESVFRSSNDFTTKVSLSNPHLERTNHYAPSQGPPTSYAPSFVSTARANDGHVGSLSTVSLQQSEERRHFRHRSNSPPPPVPMMNGIYGNGNSLTPSTTTTKPVKRGFLQRIGTMRNREKSGRNNGNAPSSISPVSPTIPNQQISSPVETVSPPIESTTPVVTNREPVPHWDDARPNGPPILGAIVEPTPPPPPPKNDTLPPSPANDTYVEPSRDPRASTMTTSTNPYGGIDDYGEVDEMGGKILFRGSKSYENGLNQVTNDDGREGSVEEVQQMSPRMRELTIPDSPIAPTENSLDVNDSRPRHPDRYMSGASNFSSRVANIVGLYEQRNGQDETETVATSPSRR